MRYIALVCFIGLSGPCLGQEQLQSFRHLAEDKTPLHFAYTTRLDSRYSSASVTEKLPDGQVRFLLPGQSMPTNAVAPNIGRLDPANLGEVIQESRPINYDHYFIDGGQITSMTLGDSGVAVWSLIRSGDQQTTVVMQGHDGVQYGFVVPTQNSILSAFDPRKPVPLVPRAVTPVISTSTELAYVSEGDSRRYKFGDGGQLVEMIDSGRGQVLETIRLDDWRPAPIPGLGKYPSRMKINKFQGGASQLTHIEDIKVRELNPSTLATLWKIFENESIRWQPEGNPQSWMVQLMAKAQSVNTE